MNKSDLTRQLKSILTPIISCYNNIGYFGNHESCHGPNISWFEMFCRSSYGIIAYTKATGDRSFLDAFCSTLLKVVSDKRYSSFQDYDQKVVELVPVATILLLFRENTWDDFTSDKKNEIEKYLTNINKVALCDNNWVFFRLLVCKILQELTGVDYARSIQRDWQTIDSFYQGDGWYRDGLEGTKDYYNPFGFHFYSLLYYYLFDDIDRKQIIKERAILFAKQYIYFFDKEGRSIPFGRSLIYRYASLSFWSMMLVNGLLNDTEAKDAKRIISMNYEWWSKQSIYDQQGFQSLGYIYPNEYMLEAYNSSGSVYWSLKFFMLLLADNNSLIWKEQEKDQEKNDISKVENHRVANGDILIQETNLGNIAFVNSYHGSGQAQDFSKYMHFAYHSATGFNICKSSNNFKQLSDDNSLIFNIDGCKKMRAKNLLYTCKDNIIQEFLWSIDNIIDIVTTVVLMDGFYVRIHVIRSKVTCECYETGFPVQTYAVHEKYSDNNFALVSDYNSASFICLLKGQGRALVIKNEEYSNIYHSETMLPALHYDVKRGVSIIIDATGYTPKNIQTKDFIDKISQKIEIKNKVAIINRVDNTLVIPLYLTNKVSKQFFVIKSKRHIRIVMRKIKNIIKNK